MDEQLGVPVALEVSSPVHRMSRKLTVVLAQ